MAKIYKLKKDGKTIYPATIGQAVINEETGENVHDDLALKANHGYESNPKTLKEVEDFVSQSIVQVETDLNILISDVVEDVPVNILSQGGYYHYNTGVFTDNTGYKSSELLSVEEGDVFYITGTIRSASTSLIHTFNSQQEKVGYVLRGNGDDEVDYSDYKFTIPSGVNFLAVTSLRIGLPIVVKKVISIQSKSYAKEEVYTKQEVDTKLDEQSGETYEQFGEIDEQLNLLLEDEISIVNLNILSQGGFYNHNDGVFRENNGYKSSELLSVEEGDVFYITGTTRSSLTSLIHTFNSQQEKVGYVLRGNGDDIVDYSDYEFTIPSGVNFLAVTSLRDGLPIVVKKLVGLTSKSYTKKESDNLYQPKVTELPGVKTYGVKWDRTNPVDYGQRTKDSIGLNATIGIGNINGQSDFDDIYPWSEIKRCNLKTNENGAKIVIFEGDENFSLDGTNGDVFVRIPKCCVNKFRDGNFDIIEVSSAGNVHPAFIENGKELDEIFVSAFEGYSENGKLRSKANVIPTSNLTPQEFLNLATANGNGYTLYDMRTMDLIYSLIAVEFGNRNTNRIFGYGLSDFYQGTSSNHSLYSSQSTNQITVSYTPQMYRLMVIGSNMRIDSPTDIKAFRKITNVQLDNETSPTSITFTFDGEPVDIDTTYFVGSAAQDTNWSETCYVNTVDATKQLSWHTGRGNLSYNSNDVRTINPMRWRYIENLFGNLWHFFPDVSFNNLQMYICSDISSYEMHKISEPYKPFSSLFVQQSDNGSKSDVLGRNFWITELNHDVFSKHIPFGRKWNLNQLSSEGFGAYYYMNADNVIIANGGGFDHLWRCNILTNRAWVTSDRKWYLYGARLIYKNI